MAAKRFKLEKLKITPEDGGANNPLSDVTHFEAMFNPASLKQTFALKWSCSEKVINSSSEELKYSHSPPQELKLELHLDGTGVDEDLGILTLERKSVKQRIDEFLAVTYVYHGDLHEPHRLIVSWGKWSFTGRFSSADITYTAFDRSGEPLRAKIDVTFLTDEALKKRLKKENKSSPDLTHSRLVHAGDTLPLLTRQIYGSPERYLDVARYNGLDDFRVLEPGRTLLFPPLATLTGGT